MKKCRFSPLEYAIFLNTDALILSEKSESLSSQDIKLMLSSTPESSK
ncbi:hypothetical protein PHOSAC3_150182 [Mesotoga infera]|nr:hypothetical protein PHOSAC3_150182 [Mesotoga infera]